MKVAALDLGSNTFLCLVAEGDQAIQRVISDEVEVVRLGQGVDKAKRFAPEALERARVCLTKFKKTIDHHKADRILAVATAAARDVENKNELFEIAKKLEIPLEIISGEDEAKFSYLGACGDKDVNKNYLVVDIGGGSTEFIIGNGPGLVYSKSVQIGAVRMTEKFISQQPTIPFEQKNLEKFIGEALKPVFLDIKKFHIDEIVAVAGTPTALAKILIGGEFDSQKINGFQISISQLEEWKDIFSQTSIDEKKSLYDLGGRADIIFAGTTILFEILKEMKTLHLTVSTKGLRYGVATELLSLR